MTDPTQLRSTLKSRNICVIVPTYNNASTIKDVINDISTYCDDIIVVNDGSTDNTLEILNSTDNIVTVSYENNRGKGHALKAGFKKARELNFAYAITMDGDGQHLGKDIATFLEYNQKYPGALIIGKRDLKGIERSSGSAFANKFSNFWFFVQTFKKVSDTQSGFRLYPLKKLYGLPLLTSRYEAELELLVMAAWHGVKIVSAPINVYYPPKEKRVSHFRPAYDFTRISILNTVLCFLSLVYGLPLTLLRYLLRFLRTLYSMICFLFVTQLIFAPGIWIYLKTRKDRKKKAQGLHRFLYKVAKFIMYTHGIPGTKFRANKDSEALSKPSVIVCNHQSHLDLICLLTLTPKIIFLTNDWVWNNPLLRIYIRNAQYFPVSYGIDNILPQLRDLVGRGYSICVFPEGTRSQDCKISRFHQGAFYIAKELNIGIQTICIYGAGKVLPKKKYILNKGVIYLETGKYFSLEFLSSLGDFRKQASYTTKLYRRWYSDICNRIEQDV